MQKLSKLDSKELLDNLLAKFGSVKVGEHNVQEMEREIEKKMASFHMAERERTAKVAEDLSKFVITS